MRSLFLVGIMTVAAGIGSALIAGPAQADVWQNAVCGKGLMYGNVVTVGGQKWTVQAKSSDGREYILRDGKDRKQTVRCP